MKPQMKERIDRFAELSQLYRPLTKWDCAMMDKLCALQCVCSGKEADLNKYKACRTYIRDHAGFLLAMKGEMLPVVTWQMAAEEEPQSFFQKLQDCYGQLRQEGLTACDYLVVSALYLVQSVDDFPLAAARMKKIDRAMKQVHPFAAGPDGYTAAAMLAAAGITVPEYQQRLSRIEELLHNWLARGNKLRSAANMILLFNVDDIALCERAINLQQSFHERGYDFKSHNMTALLALLAISKTPAAELADEVIEAGDYLKSKKGFRSLSSDKGKRAVLAAGLYLARESEAKEEGRLSGAAIRSMTIDYLLAVRTMCICCLAAVSAPVASSSGAVC